MRLAEKIKEREGEFEKRLENHILIRLDGKNFSKYTRNLKKPFDDRLVTSMQEVTRKLMVEFGAQAGYTQSDEISLFLKAEEGKEHYLGGRLQKLCSLSAAYTTSVFTSHVWEKGLGAGFPVFDSRVWEVENLQEVVDTFIWRERDCIKNSISSLAQRYFPRNELYKKNSSDKIKMLREDGIIWDDMPKAFKFGTYFIKTKVKRSFNEKELLKLPPKHEAHQNPNLEIERNEIVQVSTNGYKNCKNYKSFILNGDLK